MVSTIAFAASALFILIAGVAAWALFLRLGLRWTRVPGVTTRGVLLVTLLIFLIQRPLAAFVALLLAYSKVPALLVGAAALLVSIGVPILIIGRAYGLSLVRSFQAWLPTLVATVGMVLCVSFVFRPFLFEAFVVPTNSMAPTLLGKHWQATCPECGQPCYCTPAESSLLNDPPMICSNFHTVYPSLMDRSVHNCDRFLVCKFLAPRRWDMVAFRVPGNPEIMYVKRLVGLPDETITIQDGSVWADGNRLVPPQVIEKINYVSEMPERHATLWGSKDRLAELGDDEYFVLGDFSAQAFDSRLWEVGAPGHNPFAVPKTHFVGVVTHVYWPPKRWRVLR